MNIDGILVGLGNPGSRYAFTRHNVGFIALDLLAQELGARFATAKKWQAEALEATWKGHKLLLLKPQTYMNLSGQTLQALYAQHNHLREKPLIVLHDEVDIPMGQLRVKLGGGDAGHNGLKSIRALLGHGDYYRVRMGVGRPVTGSNIPMADYVLGPFRDDEKDVLAKLLTSSLDVTELLLEGKLAKAQELASRV